MMMMQMKRIASKHQVDITISFHGVDLVGIAIQIPCNRPEEINLIYTIVFFNCNAIQKAYTNALHFPTAMYLLIWR
jgi:hypothetical protein